MSALGFIGLGNMGSAMTRRLLDAGHELQVWNRTPSKTDAIAAAGARVVDSRARLAAESEVVLLCVSDADAVREVVFGAHGVNEGLHGGCTLVDHSSITPWATREMGERVAADHGVAWVDAPVSGGVPGAEAGTLAVMAGGDADALERVRPVLGAYAAHVTRLGPLGAGQTAKLCNQVLVAGTLALVAEAVTLARDGGIDAGRLPEALAGGWADSPVFRIFVPRMVSGYDATLGRSRLMLKDVDAALELARQIDAELPTATVVRELFARLVDAGRGDDDLAGIIDVLRG